METKDYGYRTGEDELITEEFDQQAEGEQQQTEGEAEGEQTESEAEGEQQQAEGQAAESEAEGEQQQTEKQAAESETEGEQQQAEGQTTEAEAETEQQAEAAAPVDWKTQIKDVDKWEVLSTLGFDEFSIGMLKYKEKTGDVTPYLEAKTVDYTKMSPEQLLRLDLKKKNEGMSERALNIKLKKEIEDKYCLDRELHPEDSDEAVLGQEQLRLDAEQVRKAFIENQKSFKEPESLPDLDATRKEAEMQQLKASLGNGIMNDAATVNLKKAKTLTFGKGEASFNYPIKNVQPLIDAALTTIVESGRKDLKGINLNTFYKQLTYGSDPDGFEKEWADHIEAVAKKKFQKRIQNVKPKATNPSKPTEEDLTPAQQLARHGRYV